MSGYEGLVLLRFTNYNDLVIETKFKSQFLLAICMNYYHYGMPVIPATASAHADINSSKSCPIPININRETAIPVFCKSPSPEAVIIQTRFPSEDYLGECLVVSTRNGFAADRFLKPVKRVSTAIYVADLVDLNAAVAENNHPVAVAVLYQDMMLELYASPTDEKTSALYSVDLHPKTRKVQPVALDSGETQTTGGLLSTFTSLLNAATTTATSFYAIKFRKSTC
ncbi:hypothetical protein GNI_023140 [Gregarina niphandrodes]|uniref:Uncharacterized protein n=1 Tax=Gregarina niphandrodes TaxID=110365 RepID=A0A023BBS5_GRENI|nr:hypothetical protein GNI_023140 [Gregarina niphandrodes]EZG79998.1 hypothetical protein GNI_023140 [Gregarina niphandrodes]|eukprot:XP_011134344.1 hypothetical protein GNI_023140 [Gregarina niphandrodes]